MPTVISVENLSKTYRLGQIGTGTFSRDLEVWWAKLRGKPNPLLRIGEKDHGNRDGEELWALRDVSFTVEQGEVLGIIGPNGAGKSTLLKILSHVTAPTSGRIKVKGRIASLLEVGTGFHPELTGRENIYLNGAILGMKRDEITRKFDEIVDFAEVEKFIDTPVKRYSSGMYVRLAFAVAAHLEPEILVVDEVLAVGDAKFQKKCLGKMQDISELGRTVIFVSHNMNAIQQICQRAVILDSGKITADGKPEDIVHVYLRDNHVHGQVSRQSITLQEINIAIEQVKTLNMEGIEKVIFKSGEPFVVRYYIQNNERQMKIALFASVEDSALKRLFASYSAQEGQYFDLKIGHNIVDFVIPQLPLNEGVYSVTVTMHLDGHGVCIYRIDQANYFRVHGLQEKNTEVFFNTDLGPLTVNHFWSIPQTGINNIIPE